MALSAVAVGGHVSTRLNALASGKTQSRPRLFWPMQADLRNSPAHIGDRRPHQTHATSATPLPGSVMVAPQFLVLLVEVQILAG